MRYLQIDKYVQFWLPKKASQFSEIELYFSRIAILYTWIACIAIICYGTLFVLCESPSLIRTAAIALSMTALSLLAVKYLGSWMLAGVNLLIWAEFAIIETTRYTGGIDSPVLYWQIVFPLASILLIGRWSLLIAMTIPLGSYLVFQYIGPIEPILEPEIMQWVYHITFGTAVIVSAGFAFTYQLQRDSAYALVEQRNKSLRRTMAEKNTLFRALYHDLVNPMQVMTSCITLAEAESEMPPFQARLWQKVKRAVESQNSIICELKEIEAVTSGKKNIALEPVDLGKVVKNCFFLFEDRLVKKNIFHNLSSDNPEWMGTKVSANEAVLTHSVFGNLISNAIKFTHAGGKIFLSVREYDGRVLFELTDTGIGVPKQLKKHLFEPNEPTSRPGTAGEKGTGFGLLLVRAYVERFGGEIFIRSTSIDENPNDHGTTVSLSFPIASRRHRS